MNIIKDIDNKRISIVENNEVLMGLYFVPSYFVCDFSKKVNVNNPIIISKEIDKYLYDNLKWLMSQRYFFPHQYSYKNDNQLVWLSEHCFNLEDEFEVDNTPRLVIEYIDELFRIYCVRPFFEKNNINRGSCISMAPAGNGYLSKNIDTGFTFQGDMISMFLNTLESKKLSDLKKVK